MVPTIGSIGGRQANLQLFHSGVEDQTQTGDGRPHNGEIQKRLLREIIVELFHKTGKPYPGNRKGRTAFQARDWKAWKQRGIRTPHTVMEWFNFRPEDLCCEDSCWVSKAKPRSLKCTLRAGAMRNMQRAP